MVNNPQYNSHSLLSVAEAAELLGISRIGVLQRIRRGKLQAEKVGKAYVIRYSHIVGELTEETKESIEKTVRKAVEEYGETFKLLGKE